MKFLRTLLNSLKVELKLLEKPKMPSFGQLDEYPSNMMAQYEKDLMRNKRRNKKWDK